MPALFVFDGSDLPPSEPYAHFGGRLIEDGQLTISAVVRSFTGEYVPPMHGSVP